MKKQRDSDASFLMGVVLGLVVGAGIALVLSPGTGEENRAKVKNTAQDAIGQVSGKAEEMRDKVTQKIDEATGKVEEEAKKAKEEVQEVVDEAKSEMQSTADKAT
jgi:gas vesicle protein